MSELKRQGAEPAPSEAERLLAMVESMAGVGHWRTDLRTGRSIWSDEVYRIHGVDRASFDPSNGAWMQHFPADDVLMLRALGEDAKRRQGGFEVEHRIVRPDGELREVRLRATTEVDAQGEVVALFGVIQDVTEHNRALRDYRRGEARYKLLAENMADAVTRIRLDGGSNYMSPAIESLIGYTASEMNGRTAQSFVYPPDRALIDETFATLAAGQEEATVQLRAQHRDGHPVWVETRFRLIRDDDGEPSEMVAVIRDITDRKALEADLTKAREAAEAAALVKSQFLANMSHELRTPLNSIIGFTGLTLDQPSLPPLARDYVQRVENASRALLCTVNDILDFSRLEAGVVGLKPEPTDAVALCRATLELLTPQAAAKDLRLGLTLDAPSDLIVAIDPDRVRQVVLNLVGNAVKFTERGQVTLELAYDAGAQSLSVAVDDTGPGIAAPDLAKLFKRFSQVDGSTTRAHGGTGLGLAICKGLIEAMGGAIGADSVPGRGSRFWFTLPAPLVRGGGLSRPRTADPTVSLTGARVLVVDDHPANRELARLFLGGGGAQVDEAPDGETAVAIAAETPFDVILMDMRMPKLDGVGALHRIRDGGGPNAGTPIVAYTAEANRTELDRLVHAGFAAVAVKPVAPMQLLAAVAEALAVEPGPALSRQAG